MAGGLRPRVTAARPYLVAAAVLTGLAWFAVVCYVAFVIFAQAASFTWEEQSVWEAVRRKIVIEYHMHSGEEPKIWDGWEGCSMVLTLVPIAIAAIAATSAALLSDMAGTKNPHCNASHGPIQQVKQACAQQLPPYRFWLQWCEGLSVLEAVLVIGWAVMHIVVVNDLVGYYVKMMDSWAAAGLYFNAPRSIYKLEWIGIAWGWLLWPNLALLFMPVAHNSFLNYLTGLPYSALVRFHRWIGQFTMVTLCLHGSFYYLYWLATPELSFWDEALDWGTKSTINFLAGSIAWLFGLILWITAMEWVRRRFFEVFYKMHITCFLGFLVFGMIHFWWNWGIFVPGLALYCADVIFRVWQAQNLTVAILADNVGHCDGHHAKDGVVVMVDIPVAEDTAMHAGQDLFLLAPSITRWQWHPFTVAYVNESGTAPVIKDTGYVAAAEQAKGCKTARLCIKTAGSWTQELVAQLLKGPVPMRVVGPLGAIDMHKYLSAGALLLVAGGIGVAPVLAIVEEMLAARNKGERTPANVKVIWVARHSDEFALLDEKVAQAASSESKWMSISLYCTTLKVHADFSNGSADTRTGTGPQAVTCSNSASNPQLAASSKCPMSEVGHQATAAKGIVVDAARSTVGCVCSALRLCSGVMTRQLPMQPQVCYGAVERCIVLMLTLLGGFMGVVLAQSMYNEWSAIPGYHKATYPAMAVMYIIIVAVQMLGLPVALWLFPSHLYRHFVQAKHDSLCAAEWCTGVRRAPCVVGGSMLVYPETGTHVPVAPGRPDLMAAVQWAADRAAAPTNTASVEVVCAGPAALNYHVQELVSKHNRKHGAGRQYLNFTKETFQL